MGETNSFDHRNLNWGLLLVAAFGFLFLELPLRVHMLNPGNFKPTGTAELTIFYVFLLAIFVVLYLLLWLVSRNWRSGRLDFVLVFLSAVIWGGWIQSFVFQWDYGGLTGELIDWRQYWYMGAIDSLFWVVLLVGVIYQRHFVRQHLWKFNLVLVLFSLSHIVPDAYSTISKTSDSGKISLDYSKIFTFSNDENLVLLVLDTFQSNIALDEIQNSPYLAEAYRDFTYYPNASTGSYFTEASIPVVLTGQDFNNSMGFNDYYDPLLLNDSIFSRLKQQDYEIENYSRYFNYSSIYSILDNAIKSHSLNEIPRYADSSLINLAPFFLKRFIYNDGSWLLSASIEFQEFLFQFTSKFFDSVVRGPKRSLYNNDKDTGLIEHMEKEGEMVERNKVFKFYHLWGAHPNYNFNRDGSRSEKKKTSKNYEDTVYYKLSLVARFMDKLKEIGAYDNTSILLVGDHGAGYHSSLNLFADPDTGIGNNLGGYPARAATTFLVKSAVGNNQLKINQNPIDLASSPAVFNSLVERTEIPTLRKDAVRKFLYSNWKSNFNAPLDKYFEYLLLGHTWKPDSLLRYHDHGTEQDFDACVFDAFRDPSLIYRSQVKDPEFNKLEFRFQVKGSPEFLNLILSGKNVDQEIIIEAFANNIRIDVLDSISNKKMAQKRIDFSSIGGNNSALVTVDLRISYSDQVSGIKLNDIVVIGEGRNSVLR